MSAKWLRTKVGRSLFITFQKLYSGPNVKRQPVCKLSFLAPTRVWYRELLFSSFSSNKN